jgi:hypothetical protein
VREHILRYITPLRKKFPNICHAELVSASTTSLLFRLWKILKQVQDEK